MKPKILSEIEAVLKVSGLASALPKWAKDRMCHSVAIDIVAYYEPLIEQAKSEVVREIIPHIKEALEAPTHEANDYNCEDWPIGQGCSGCKGDKIREEAIKWLATCESKYGG